MTAMKRSLTRKPRLNEAWNYTCHPTETCIGSTLLEVHVMIFLTSEQSLQLNAVFQHAGVLFDSPPKLLVHFQASGAFSKGKKMTDSPMLIHAKAVYFAICCCHL